MARRKLVTEGNENRQGRPGTWSLGGPANHPERNENLKYKEGKRGAGKGVTLKLL
ncbi:hypothetical protein NQZ68_033469 [Dissostichus eleginoides]|nr:hypothetical protein NQZ68_033469 [Dissostichus eleginoides]